MDSIEQKSTLILKQLYGNSAKFRQGQLEAIISTMSNQRTLVVQKTGWGKSLVYFICTKLFREQKRGATFVVSPLLVLMQNQIEAAKKLNIKCDALNSATKDRRDEIIQKLKNNELDLIFITPETLFNEEIQNELKDIEIGLFVIDEAHCISDWGHDFRLEYGNLIKVIKKLPANVPLLATTATANDRVVEDLKHQFGDDVNVLRGPLTRESLILEVVHLEDKADRYTWIIKNINKLPGSGIIYCLTQRDCDYLANFLNKNNISAEAYHSRKDEKENIKTVTKFQNNEIKAIVATIKLGMGFDKGDIGFVIHFQRPGNIVSYYQQIGRAGRNIDEAYAILMTGKEDEEINDHFINTAFPTKEECESVIEIIEQNNGASSKFILSKVNMRVNRLEKVLNFLLNDNAIFKDGYRYYLTANIFKYNKEYYDQITAVRRKEKLEMNNLTTTNKCLSKFVANCLDDNSAIDCGRCSNCKGSNIIDSIITLADKEKALNYINSLLIEIEPRKMWPKTALTEHQKIEFVNETGVCLSKYGDVGYGALVKEDKYKNKEFCSELIGKSASILKPIIIENDIKYLTNIPSLRSSMVEDFAKKLAEKLNIKYINTLSKSPAKQQKLMENSSFQCENALMSFQILEGITLPEKVILIDDIIDSRWTMTVCGYKLMENGVKMVIPFALADSSNVEV